MKKVSKLIYSVICGIITCFIFSIYLAAILLTFTGYPPLSIPIIIAGPIVGGIFGYTIVKKTYPKLKIANYITGTVCIAFWILNVLSPKDFHGDMRNAEFKIENTPYSIEMQIANASPVGLDENYRRVLLKENNKKIVKKEMSFDSGGYLKAELYKIDSEHYWLDGYLIDLSNKTITTAGTSTKQNGVFLGYFDWWFCIADGIGADPCANGQSKMDGFKFIKIIEPEKIPVTLSN
jgi:hypothetical protein